MTDAIEPDAAVEKQAHVRMFAQLRAQSTVGQSTSSAVNDRQLSTIGAAAARNVIDREIPQYAGCRKLLERGNSNRRPADQGKTQVPLVKWNLHEMHSSA